MKHLVLISALCTSLVMGCSLLNSNSNPCGKCPPATDPDKFYPVRKEPVYNLEELAKKVVYPVMARRASIEGRIAIRVLVGCDGKPIRTMIEMSDNEIFNKNAIDAVMDMNYEPAECDDGPVSCWVSIPITFKLR